MAGSLQTLIRDLRLRRGRERRGLTLAEGVRLVEEAVGAGIEIHAAAVAPALESTARGRALKATLEQAGIRLTAVSDRDLVELADTDHPQGIVAVIEPRRWDWTHLVARPGTVIIALDAVQDPGNVGTIVRTGLALGAGGVVALKGSAELLNPKVVRGSMGALFRLPAISASEDELVHWMKDNGAELWVATSDGSPIRALPARPPVCLVLGNEGAGVSPGLVARAQRRLSIPLAPGAESLNVAVAAGILLYELTRAG